MSCPEGLLIRGEFFPCDMECVDTEGNVTDDHSGWPHSNRDAEAIWGKRE